MNTTPFIWRSGLYPRTLVLTLPCCQKGNSTWLGWLLMLQHTLACTSASCSSLWSSFITTWCNGPAAFGAGLRPSHLYLPWTDAPYLCWLGSHMCRPPRSTISATVTYVHVNDFNSEITHTWNQFRGPSSWQDVCNYSFIKDHRFSFCEKGWALLIRTGYIIYH